MHGHMNVKNFTKGYQLSPKPASQLLYIQLNFLGQTDASRCEGFLRFREPCPHLQGVLVGW